MTHLLANTCSGALSHKPLTNNTRKGISIMTKSYRVTWTIDVDADGPREAAAKALEIQRDTESTATVFNVVHTQEVKSTIDLGHISKHFKSGGTP
jgi:hypothetical protein